MQTKTEWTRNRYFFGPALDHEGKQTGIIGIFACKYTPTQLTHGERYAYVFGPYKTRFAAWHNAHYQFTSPSWFITHK